MKSLFTALIILFQLSFAKADVNEKLHLESALENRIEKGLRHFDPTLHVQISVGYKKYESMPGTSIEGLEDISPSTIDEVDIAKIYVSVTSQHKNIPADIKQKIFKLIPVEKNRISLKFIFEPAIPVKVATPVEPKDLSTIANDFSSQITKVFFIGISCLLCLILIYSYTINSKNMNSFKTKFNELIEALQQSSFSQTSSSSYKVATSENDQTFPQATNSDDISFINDFSIESLTELMGDCYWCHEDSYAHWLWKQLHLENKKNLLTAHKDFKNYVSHFLNEPPINKKMHEHPYYIQPLCLNLTSQEDLQSDIAKNQNLWKALSPIRKQHLEIPIEKKLKLIDSNNNDKIDWKFKSSSILRSFNSMAQFGNISNDDELVLFQQPELVPKNWRINIPTLLWLSQRPEPYIAQTLERFDARSLATGWIGTREVLDILEKHLPEKKLKLLKNYQSQITASKQSACFQDLFNAGLHDEAA